jgi:shikimate kinase
VKLFLVGFMGCGKSYVGRLLAAKFGFLFVDVDSIIENTEGVTIAQIFEDRGEAAFRQLESDTLRGLKKWDNIVIATGGGAACFHNNINWMNENGVTIYLKATPTLLLSRLKNETHHRPILGGRTDDDLLHFIESKVAERKQYYEQAAFIIEQTTDGDQVVTDIIDALYNRSTLN